MQRLLHCGAEIHPQWNPSAMLVVYTCSNEINFDLKNWLMQMMMGAHRMSQTQTTLDLNVVIVVLITHLSGEGAKLEISFVTHAVCMLVFGENLGLSRSKETKFDRDLNTFPSEISYLSAYLQNVWATLLILGRSHALNIIFDTHTHHWTLNETNNNIGLDIAINLDAFFTHCIYVYVFFWGGSSLKYTYSKKVGICITLTQKPSNFDDDLRSPQCQQ